MKKYRLIFLLVFIHSFVFGIGYNLTIVEQVGVIDIKQDKYDWQSPIIGDSLQEKTKVYTGLHSRISFEIGKGSYLTVEQLSEIEISRIAKENEQIFVEIKLLRGYLIIYSKYTKQFEPQILINSNLGYALFKNSGGEVLYKANDGVRIKGFIGKIKVKSKYKNTYVLKKSEICKIKYDGIILENDYFLKRSITSTTGFLKMETINDAFYLSDFQPYTFDTISSSYNRALNP